jgi:hypothetical protein
MKQIFKCRLKFNLINPQYLRIPCNRILYAENQNNDIVVHVEFDSDLPNNGYEFLIYGIGHIQQDDIGDYIFLNTVIILDGGDVAFHIYYKQIY